MQYETPVLLLVAPAKSIVLGDSGFKVVDRLPESEFKKREDIEEGLDE